MNRSSLALTVVLTIALVACNGDADGDTTTTAPGNQATGGSVMIQVTEIAYPDSTTFPAGQQVVFDNSSGVGHTVSFLTKDGATFDDSYDLASDATLEIDLEPGTYTYFCQIHPTMNGEIVVEG